MRILSMLCCLVGVVAGQLFTPIAQAALYDLDPSHTFIEFRTKHLGYSWLYGRFKPY